MKDCYSQQQTQKKKKKKLRAYERLLFTQKKKQLNIIANNLNNHSSIKQAKHYKLQS